MWGNIAEDSCDVCDCSSMIASNAAFTMSTLTASAAAAAVVGSSTTTTSSRRAESRAQRRLHTAAVAAAAAAIQPAFDEPATINDKSSSIMADELSFYDCGSPARSCASSPCMDMDMYSPQSSPIAMHSASIAGNNNNNNNLNSHHHHHHHHSAAAAQRSFNFDYNSRDSGYGASTTGASSVAANSSVSSAISGVGGARTCFQFAEPTGVAPKQSPPKQSTTTSCFRAFNSVGTDSVDSMDDDYMELLDMEAAMDEDAATHAGQHGGAHTSQLSHLPSHFSSIISGTIRSQSPVPPTTGGGRAPLRRCLSLIENTPKTPEPLLQKAEHTMMTTVTMTTPLSAAAQMQRAFKRPEAPAFSPTMSKRFKGASGELSPPLGKENASPSVAAAAASNRHLVRKSISMNDASIMSALARSSTEPDLIGDFSKPYALPLMEGRHRDLKSISAATMAKLLRGDYAESVASFRVVDCRYPYEFEGGHIAGAENLYTQEEVLRELVHSRGATEASVQADGPKRNIVVFHCEFSSERGPKLSRFLRNHDRQCNTNVYPALHYPEVYLLHGGYKEFYEANLELCAPQAYRQMLDPAYGKAYKHFRAQTKSWSGDAKTGAGGAVASGPVSTRLVKSRSRLVL